MAIKLIIFEVQLFVSFSVFTLPGFNAKVGFNVKTIIMVLPYKIIVLKNLKTYFELFFIRFYKIKPCF